MAVDTTSKPVPNSSYEVARSNLETLDKYLNSEASGIVNRAGKTLTPIPALQESLETLVESTAFVPVEGSFQLGGTIATRNDVLLNTADNSYYSWGGALPKSVLVGSTPATAGGLGVDKWVLRGDSALRSQLAAVDSTVLVGGVQAKDLGAFPANLAAADSTILVGGVEAGDLSRKYGEFKSVKDFGAVGDGVVDDTAAIQLALSETPSNSALYFPAGTYKLTSEILLGAKSNIRFVGLGAKIIGTSSRFRSYFNITGASNITFEGFEFDLMFSVVQQYIVADWPNEYNVAIYAAGAASGGLSVEYCTFKRLYTKAISVNNCLSLEVRNCKFFSPTQNQNQMLEHITCITARRLTVDGNVFDNAPPSSPASGVCNVFFSGVRDKTDIMNNFMNYSGRNNDGSHRLAAIDLYYDASNVTIKNNVSLNTIGQFMRFSTCWSGEISGNYVEQSGSSETQYTMLSVEGFYLTPPPAPTNVGTKDVVIENNVFKDEFNRQEFCIGIFAYEWGLPTQRVKILNNVTIGAKVAVGIQGPFKDIEITGNTFDGFRSEIWVFGNRDAPTITSLYGTQANSVMDNLVIENNTFRQEVVGQWVSRMEVGPLAPYTGYVGKISFKRNSMFSSGSNTVGVGGGGFYFNGAQPSATAIIELTENTARQCDYVFAIVKALDVEVTDNKAQASDLTAFLFSDQNGNVFRRGNKLSVGKSSGTAQLSGGTVTVNTPEIRVGDQVLLSRMTATGTLGNLSIGAINNKTSFVINSSSASDDSTIYFEVIH